MKKTKITDTERVDWMAGVSERTQGLPAAEFRAQLDEKILAERLPDAPAWLELTADFPPNDVPVLARTRDGNLARVRYGAAAGDWFVHCPGSAIHGRRWTGAEITHWTAGVSQPTQK